MAVTAKTERGDGRYDVPSFMRDFIRYWLYYDNEGAGVPKIPDVDPDATWTEVLPDLDPEVTWAENQNEFVVTIGTGADRRATIHYGKSTGNPANQIYVNFHQHPNGKDVASVFINGVEYVKSRGVSFWFSATTPAIETLLSGNPRQRTNVKYVDGTFAVDRSLANNYLLTLNAGETDEVIARYFESDYVSVVDPEVSWADDGTGTDRHFDLTLGDSPNDVTLKFFADSYVETDIRDHGITWESVGSGTTARHQTTLNAGGASAVSITRYSNTYSDPIEGDPEAVWSSGIGGYTLTLNSGNSATEVTVRRLDNTYSETIMVDPEIQWAEENIGGASHTCQWHVATSSDSLYLRLNYHKSSNTRVWGVSGGADVDRANRLEVWGWPSGKIPAAVWVADVRYSLTSLVSGGTTRYISTQTTVPEAPILASDANPVRTNVEFTDGTFYQARTPTSSTAKRNRFFIAADEVPTGKTPAAVLLAGTSYALTSVTRGGWQSAVTDAAVGTSLGNAIRTNIEYTDNSLASTRVTVAQDTSKRNRLEIATDNVPSGKTPRLVRIDGTEYLLTASDDGWQSAPTGANLATVLDAGNTPTNVEYTDDSLATSRIMMIDPDSTWLNIPESASVVLNAPETNANSVIVQYFKASSAILTSKLFINNNFRPSGKQPVAIWLNHVRYPLTVDSSVLGNPGYASSASTELEALITAGNALATNVEYLGGEFALTRTSVNNTEFQNKFEIRSDGYPSGKTPDEIRVAGQTYSLTADSNGNFFSAAVPAAQSLLVAGAVATNVFYTDGSATIQDTSLRNKFQILGTDVPTGKTPDKMRINNIGYDFTAEGSNFITAAVTTVEASITSGNALPTNVEYSDDSLAVDKVDAINTAELISARNKLEAASREYLKEGEFSSIDDITQLMSVTLLNDTYTENNILVAAVNPSQPISLFLYEGSMSRNAVGPGFYEHRTYDLNCRLLAPRSRAAIYAFWDFLNVLLFNYNRLREPFTHAGRSVIEAEGNSAALLPNFVHQINVTQISEIRQNTFWEATFDIVFKSFGSYRSYDS